MSTVHEKFAFDGYHGPLFWSRAEDATLSAFAFKHAASPISYGNRALVLVSLVKDHTTHVSTECDRGSNKERTSLLSKCLISIF